MNADIRNIAALIAAEVVAAGRVVGDGEGWLESLAVEVEFEARAQGYEDSARIAQIARAAAERNTR